MTAKMYQRGHEIYYDDEKEEWLYSDNNSSAKIDRPCKRCGVKATIFGHDACLKDLTDCIGIVSACCGHGNDDLAYISLKDGRLFVLSEWSVKE